jgi:hypothetical protein
MFPVWIAPQLDIILYFIAIAISFIYTHTSSKEHAYDVRLFVRKNLQAIKYREEQFIAIHCVRYEETFLVVVVVIIIIIVRRRGEDCDYFKQRRRRRVK